MMLIYLSKHWIYTFGSFRNFRNFLVQICTLSWFKSVKVYWDLFEKLKCNPSASSFTKFRWEPSAIKARKIKDELIRTICKQKNWLMAYKTTWRTQIRNTCKIVLGSVQFSFVTLSHLQIDINNLPPSELDTIWHFILESLMLMLKKWMYLWKC